MVELYPTYARIAEALDGLDTAICIFDEDDRAVVWNRAFLSIFPEHDGAVHKGEPYQDNLRRFYLKRLGPRELPEIERHIADGIARHRAQSRPFVFLHDGQWLKVSSLPLPEGGRVRLWSHIASPGTSVPVTLPSRDVADIGHADLENLADGIMILSPEGRIVSANKAVLDVYNLASRAAAIGRTYEQLLRAIWHNTPRSAAEQEAIDRYISRLAEDHRFTGSPFEIPLPGSRWVRVAEQYGNAGVIYSTHVDISALKHQQIVVNEAKLAAERANEAKSTFLAMMSHEIRTPMHGIIGMTENLLETELNEVQAGYAETIKKSSMALLSILNDILDLSKLEIGKIELAQAAFRPAVLVRDATRLLAAAAEGKGLILEVDTDPALEGDFLGDTSRIRQVLLNLLTNAVKFTPSGSVSVRAHMLAAGRLRVEIRDTGIGFDETKADRLFQTFEQAGADIARRFGGTGLGLSISRQLVELMGGEIGGQSRPEGGSLFWFEIPMRAAAPPAPAPVPAPSAPHAARPGICVLVVEDNATNQAVVKAILERAGYKVVIAGDGASALAQAGSVNPDIVLMDIQLPDTDGFALTALLRRMLARGTEIPFIALTANAMEGYRELCLAHELNDYLSKPFTRDVLLRKIRQWLEPAAA